MREAEREAPQAHGTDHRSGSAGFRYGFVHGLDQDPNLSPAP